MAQELFNEFSPSSDEQWEELILKDLKVKSLEDIARKRPYEGMDLNVFYSSGDVQIEPFISLKKDWRIIESEPFESETIDDILVHLVNTGSWLIGEAEDLKNWRQVFKSEIETRKLGVDGTPYHEAGASADFELACIIAHLNEYLHLLKGVNELRDDLLGKLSVKVGIGPDYFMEIAKLRALRVLIANLGKAYQLNHNISIDVYAENSLMNYSTRDVNTNILRATTACMSAVIGGCDHLYLRPHNYLADGDLNFGKRIARNLQLMMKHEAHLDKVLDPSAGSYFIESLTKELAEKAWSEFKSIEKKGGFIEEFKKETIQKTIQSTAKRRIEDMRSGDTVLIGINKYLLDDSEAFKESRVQPPGEYQALQALILEEHL